VSRNNLPKLKVSLLKAIKAYCKSCREGHPSTCDQVYCVFYPYRNGYNPKRQKGDTPELVRARELAHKRGPRWAIREHCISCGNGQWAEADWCVATSCPLWLLRLSPNSSRSPVQILKPASQRKVDSAEGATTTNYPSQVPGDDHLPDEIKQECPGRLDKVRLCVKCKVRLACRDGELCTTCIQVEMKATVLTERSELSSTRLLTIPQAAERLGVHRSTLYKYWSKYIDAGLEIVELP